MRKSIYFGIFSAVISLFSTESALASEAPVSVEVGKRINQVTGQANPLIIVTSRSDLVNIRDVIVNRGNCSVFAYDLGAKERSLRYGQTVTYRSNNCKKVLEIVIDTDKGSWTYTL